MEPPAAGVTKAPERRFQAGGAVRQASFYIPRGADAELEEGLDRGELCAVIAPRQMGKSSLRRRAERRVAARGVRCLAVDLGLIGAQGVPSSAWFYALAFHLAERSALALDLPRFWRAHEALPPAERWSRFVRDELIARAPWPLAVFIDELDVALGVPFCPDDFFTAVREVHAACRPVPFCLLGVTEPARWLRDPAPARFAVGRVIRPGAFTREEAAALLPGLSAAGGEPRELLDAVLAWSRGHPYLTQRLCELLVQTRAEAGVTAPARVARLVHDGSLEEGALAAVRDRSVSPA